MSDGGIPRLGDMGTPIWGVRTRASVRSRPNPRTMFHCVSPPFTAAYFRVSETVAHAARLPTAATFIWYGHGGAASRTSLFASLILRISEKTTALILLGNLILPFPLEFAHVPLHIEAVQRSNLFPRQHSPLSQRFDIG